MHVCGRRKTLSVRLARRTCAGILRREAGVRVISNRRSFFFGAKQSSRDARDHGARDEPHALGAQPIGESGNHRTLPCRKCTEAHARDFLGRLLWTPRVMALAGNFEKFAFRRSGAERADANSVMPHLLGKAFGKLQIKRFCRGVRRDVGHRLKRRRRSKDQNVSTAAGYHPRKIKMRQMYDRAHVDLYHFEEAVDRHLAEFTVRAETRIIHEQVHRNILALRECEYLFGTRRSGQVSDAHECADAMFQAELAGKACEAVTPSCCEYEIRSTRSQLPRQRCADSRARSRY